MDGKTYGIAPDMRPQVDAGGARASKPHAVALKLEGFNPN
jgi:hypothetical protein